MVKRKMPLLRSACLACGMLLLILDTRTAVSGAAAGIDLCIKTVIPSLLPFFLISNLLVSDLSGRKLPGLRWLSHILRTPPGTEYIFLAGLLGGYPTGAAMIADSCRRGSLSVKDGNRMIRFCSNAGPAFIFGIGACLFQKAWLCWAAWLITVLSAVMAAVLTPGQAQSGMQTGQTEPMSVTAAMKRSLITMGLVCGWVILFRVFLAFADRWILWLLDKKQLSIVYGIFELSNGCCSLTQIENTGMRFTMFVTFICFGGLCVALQTISLLDGSGLRPMNYLAGKLMQASVSLFLCQLFQGMLPETQRTFLPWPVWIVMPLLWGIPGVITGKAKKTVAFRNKILYTKEKST